MARVAIRRSLVVGLIIGVTAGGVSAEELAAPAASPRVRITAPTVSGKRLVGTLLRMNEASATLQKGGEVIEVPRSAITRIELSRRASRKGKGAAIGALVGLGAALAIGFATGDDCGALPEPDPWWSGLVERLNRNLCMGKGETAALTAILTVPAASLIGMGAAGGERWVRTTPDRFRLTVAPVRTGGIGAAMSLRF
jgi:hypothetical protein